MHSDLDHRNNGSLEHVGSHKGCMSFKRNTHACIRMYVCTPTRVQISVMVSNLMVSKLVYIKNPSLVVYVLLLTSSPVTDSTLRLFFILIGSFWAPGRSVPEPRQQSRWRARTGEVKGHCKVKPGSDRVKTGPHWSWLSQPISSLRLCPQLSLQMAETGSPTGWKCKRHIYVLIGVFFQVSETVYPAWSPFCMTFPTCKPDSICMKFSRN